MRADTEQRASYCPFDLGDRPEEYGLEPRIFRYRRAHGLVLGTSDSDRGRDPVLFLHGMNGSWRSWTPLLRAGRAQEGILAGAPYALFDMRSLPPPRTLHALEDLADALATQFEQLGRRVHLVGHSTGGSLALYLAASHPEAVRSVRVVSGSFCKLFDEVPRTHAFKRASSQETPLELMLRRAKLAAQLGPVTKSMLYLAWRTGEIQKVVGGLYAEPGLLPPRVRHSLFANYSARTVRAMFALGGMYDYRSIYPRVAVPVVACIGEKDPFFAMPGDCQRAHDLFRNVRWRTVTGAGHFPHIERPAEVAAWLLGNE